MLFRVNVGRSDYCLWLPEICSSSVISIEDRFKLLSRWLREREREGGRDRQTDRQTESDRQTETKRATDRESLVWLFKCFALGKIMHVCRFRK